MTTLNPREEIIELLRGFFSCPLISSLGKRGILSGMLEGSFTAQSFSEVKNTALFNSVLNYFVCLGFIKAIGRGNQLEYIATELGKKVFSRHGIFILLHSYNPFLIKMDSLLFEKVDEEKPTCDRLENVIGSGQINGRKFFPKGLEIIRNMDLGMIVDIGCGDGDFLSRVLNIFPSVNVVASDISEIAIKITLKNLQKRFPNTKIDSILADASNTPYWAKLISEQAKNVKGQIVISIWYIIHEISKGSENVVIDFFNDIYKYCPRAEVIIGEISAVSNEILADNRYLSIMPEFLFFHEISGQGVLSWDQYQKVLSNVPYELAGEVLLDPVRAGDKELPTEFIWHLKPKPA